LEEATVSESAGPAIELRIGPGAAEDVLRMVDLAADLGVDRIGVSTPLIYAHGLKIIATVRREARDVPILSNLTIHDGCFRFLALSRQHGAAFGTVSAIYNYAGCREGVRCRLATGIRVLADMTCIATSDLPRQARELEAIGMDGIVVCHGHDPARYDLARRESDGVSAVVGSVSIPVGCVVTSLEQAHAAAEQGADWLILDGATFGTDRACLQRAVTDIRGRTYPKRHHAEPRRAY
jgi:3-keto-L-gulonate-6-phosphate decarboxylase